MAVALASYHFQASQKRGLWVWNHVSIDLSPVRNRLLMAFLLTHRRFRRDHVRNAHAPACSQTTAQARVRSP